MSDAWTAGTTTAVGVTVIDITPRCFCHCMAAVRGLAV